MSSVLCSLRFEDIPDDILRNEVGSRLPPGSICRLSLVSHRYINLSKSLMQLYFRKGDQYNFGLMFDLYHLVDDAFEKCFIRRFIEGNMPEEISGCYAIQAKYSICKRYLFTDEAISYCYLSDSFPELSLMLLRHKKFTLKHNGALVNVSNPILIDAFVQSLEGIDLEFLRPFFCLTDPMKLRPAFNVLVDASKQLKHIIETGSFTFLLDGDQEVEMDSALYVLCHFTNGNADIAIKVLEKIDYDNIRALFVINLVKYPHMKPILLYLLPLDCKSSTRKHEIVLALLDLDDYSDYYIALRGREVLKGLDYLRSFEGGFFRSERPNTVSIRRLVEIGLVYSLPEETMFVLIEQADFEYTEHLMIAGLKKGVSVKFMEVMINRPFSPDRDSTDPLEYYSINAPISLELVKTIAAKWDLPNFFQKLLSCFDKSIPRRSYLQHILAVLEFHPYQIDQLIDLAFCGEGVDSAEMALDVLEFCFTKGLCLRWKYIGTPKQVSDYLNAQTSEDILNYLNVGVKLSETNSFLYEATLLLSKRADGPQLLRDKFLTDAGRRDNFSSWLAVQIIPHKSLLTPSETANLILSNPNWNSGNWNIHRDAVSYLEILEEDLRKQVLCEIIAFKPEEIADTFLVEYLTSRLYSNNLIEVISFFGLITADRFKLKLFNFPPLNRLITRHSEYERYKSRIDSGELFKNQE